MSPQPTAPRPKNPGGRRKGATVTRDALLRAALETFAERGYEAATLRAITARAGVDVSLVSHFFGGKQGLFDEAVLQQAQANLRVVATVGSGSSPGTQILTAFLDIWDNPATTLTVRELFRTALESDEHRSHLTDIIGERLTEAIHTLGLDRDGRVTPDEARLRTQLIASHLVGVGIARYVMRIDPLASTPRETLVAHLAPIMNAYLAPHSPGAA